MSLLWNGIGFCAVACQVFPSALDCSAKNCVKSAPLKTSLSEAMKARFLESKRPAHPRDLPPCPSETPGPEHPPEPHYWTTGRRPAGPPCCPTLGAALVLWSVQLGNWGGFLLLIIFGPKCVTNVHFFKNPEISQSKQYEINIVNKSFIDLF